jgi:hypothetical protein
MLATLVTILTLASGGPAPVPGSPPKGQDVLRNTTIKVFRVVGTQRRPYVELYEGGVLTMRIPSGLYSIEANFADASGINHPCGVVNVRISHRRTQRIKLSCSIK